MYINTAEEYTPKKNYIQTDDFVGIRVFDRRRLGMLFQRFKKSGAWTIPIGKRVEPEMDMFKLMMNVCRSIPVKGSRRLIQARTLTEFTIEQAMHSGDNDYTKWNVIIYHVEFKGEVLDTPPTLDERYDLRKFFAFHELEQKLDARNTITDRFLTALEKQKCLR